MTNRFKSVFCGFAAAAILQVAPISAQIITLTDQNSIAQVNAATQAGMFNWLVDGQDQLAQQWFWYRVGPTSAESAINTISAPVVTTPNARSLTLLYANSTLSVQVDYLLTGGAAGSGQSDISESIRITNSTQSPLDFHFFQYSDFDLSGSDSVQLKLGPNQYFLADQTGGSGTLAETVNTPAANHGEAGLFPATLNKLNDGIPTTLNDVTSAGPGDATWALEWDVTIAANSSFLISKDKRLAVVPEPSTWALISLGLITCALCRSRKWAKL
jgi:hypothetical protein